MPEKVYKGMLAKQSGKGKYGYSTYTLIHDDTDNRFIGTHSLLDTPGMVNTVKYRFPPSLYLEDVLLFSVIAFLLGFLAHWVVSKRPTARSN